MHVIEASNAALMWSLALEYVQREGQWQETRNGKALVVPHPVSLVYHNPLQRVIFDPVRDANPFFHLAESLWMLAGRDDAKWLDQFVGDFSSRFAQEDGRQHGAYGRRWRDWFPMEHSSVWQLEDGPCDQLTTVVRLLKNNKQDRQAVIQMWDTQSDLAVPGLKDRPCNISICLRADQDKLDMMVTCRSNDLVFGALGANAVHMSILQEYLAARIGIPVGTYTQVSFNLHLYEWALEKCNHDSAWQTWRGMVYPKPHHNLVEDPVTFDDELTRIIDIPGTNMHGVSNTFLSETFARMFSANTARKEKRMDDAIAIAETIFAPDWRRACVEWLQRRQK